jgi:hypothetical protein
VLSSAFRAASPSRTHRATGPGCTPFQSISDSVYFHPRRFNSAFHPGTEIRAAVLVNYDSRVHTTAGYVGSLQADFEPWQGIHAVALEEVLKRGGAGESVQQGTWLGLAWFPFTHFDIRLDGIRRTAASSPTETTVLAQAHVYF